MKIRLLEIVPTVNILILGPCANIMAQLIAKFILFSSCLNCHFYLRSWCCCFLLNCLQNSAPDAVGVTSNSCWKQQKYSYSYLVDGGRSKILPWIFISMSPTNSLLSLFHKLFHVLVGEKVVTWWAMCVGWCICKVNWHVNGQHCSYQLEKKKLRNPKPRQNSILYCSCEIHGQT